MKRIPEIDSWRGVLILFVVLGHVTGMVCHFSVDSVWTFMSNFNKAIYVFHMPAFFFLAGMTWKRRDDESFITFIIKKAKRLVIPYLVFGILSGVIFFLMSSSFFSGVGQKHDGYYVSKGDVDVWNMVLSLIHAGGWPENGVFRGNSVLWFLPAMFSVDVMYWVIDKICPRLWGQLAVVVALYVVAFFVPANLPWGLSRALNLIVFLTIGRWCAFMLRYAMPRWMLPLLFVALGTVCCVVPNHWAIHQSFLWYVIFDLMALWGIYVSYKMAEWAVGWNWLQRLGMATMGIMLFHKYVVVALQSKVSMVGDLCKSGYSGSLFVTFVSTMLAVIVAYALTVFVKNVCPQVLGEKSRQDRDAGYTYSSIN